MSALRELLTVLVVIGTMAGLGIASAVFIGTWAAIAWRAFQAMTP